MKVVREEQGWSQRTLAAKSGVAQNTISQLERGERQAMPSTVRKLADALAVEPSVLLEDALTPREREVAKLIAQGYSNREFAEELSIGRAKVRRYDLGKMTKSEVERVKREARAQDEHESEAWSEYYVSGKFVEVDEEFSPEQKDAILSRIGERYLETSIPALFSYNEDLFVARSRLESNDPKVTIEAAQLVLRRAKIIVEEYDNKLQSFRNLPEHYYSGGDSTIQRILDVQKALARARVAATEAVQELMDLYDVCLDTLEDQILGMRKESDELKGFVTQAPDRER